MCSQVHSSSMRILLHNKLTECCPRCKLRSKPNLPPTCSEDQAPAKHHSQMEAASQIGAMPAGQTPACLSAPPQLRRGQGCLHSQPGPTATHSNLTAWIATTLRMFLSGLPRRPLCLTLHLWLSRSFTHRMCTMNSRRGRLSLSHHHITHHHNTDTHACRCHAFDLSAYWQ